MQLNSGCILQEDVASSHDLLGEQQHGRVGGMVAGLFARSNAGGAMGGTAAAGARTAPFALGERGSILHHLDQPALIPHVWEAQGKKAPFEVDAGVG